MPTVALLLLAVSLGLAGCAGRLEVAQMPQRDADLYPWAQEQAGVAVAVDEIADPARASQYFGADLLREGVLAVNVVVSNRSDRRVMIRPQDVLLVRNRAVIDPLPLERVANAAQRAIGGVRGPNARDVEEYFASLALRETTLAPNESYQGVLFFPRPQPERERSISIMGLFERGLRMHVGVTDAETRARLRFGPFRLHAPWEDRRGFFGAPRWRGSY